LDSVIKRCRNSDLVNSLHIYRKHESKLYRSLQYDIERSIEQKTKADQIKHGSVCGNHDVD